MGAPTYRELMRLSAFREWVSHRSVRASSSALSCSQVSLLGAPIKPMDEGKKDGLVTSLEVWGLVVREGESSYWYPEGSTQMTPKVNFNPVILILSWD